MPFLKSIAGGGAGAAQGRKDAKARDAMMVVTRFMNRLLALKVDVQHDVFGFFEQARGH